MQEEGSSKVIKRKRFVVYVLICADTGSKKSKSLAIHQFNNNDRPCSRQKNPLTIECRAVQTLSLLQEGLVSKKIKCILCASFSRRRSMICLWVVALLFLSTSTTTPWTFQNQKKHLVGELTPVSPTPLFFVASIDARKQNDECAINNESSTKNWISTNIAQHPIEITIVETRDGSRSPQNYGQNG